LSHYLIDRARHKRRKKRYPGVVVSLEKDFSMPDESLPSPEIAFDYAWAAQVLRNVLTKLEEECRLDGLSVHWEVFRARVLEPIFESREAPSMAALCGRLGIGSKAQASNMIVTLKRRFKQLMRRQIRRYVDSDSEVDAEIHRLGDLFGTGAV
jgi:hypothetical protein